MEDLDISKFPKGEPRIFSCKLGLFALLLALWLLGCWKSVVADFGIVEEGEAGFERAPRGSFSVTCTPVSLKEAAEATLRNSAFWGTSASNKSRVFSTSFSTTVGSLLMRDIYPVSQHICQLIKQLSLKTHVFGLYFVRLPPLFIWFRCFFNQISIDVDDYTVEVFRTGIYFILFTSPIHPKVKNVWKNHKSRFIYCTKVKVVLVHRPTTLKSFPR